MVEVQVKVCTKCKEYKPLTEFSKDRTAKDGLQYACKKCATDNYRQWKLNNSDRAKNYVSKYRIARKKFILDYLLEHNCVDCGEADPIVLEFDHVRGEKKFSIAESGPCRPLDSIIEEIAKCEVVCANCHKRRTSMRANHFRYRMLN